MKNSIKLLTVLVTLTFISEGAYAYPTCPDDILGADGQPNESKYAFETFSYGCAQPDNEEPYTACVRTPNQVTPYCWRDKLSKNNDPQCVALQKLKEDMDKKSAAAKAAADKTAAAKIAEGAATQNVKAIQNTIKVMTAISATPPAKRNPYQITIFNENKNKNLPMMLTVAQAELKVADQNLASAIAAQSTAGTAYGAALNLYNNAKNAAGNKCNQGTVKGAAIYGMPAPDNKLLNLGF